MKKLISIIVVLSISVSTLMAQNSAHERGNFSIEAGIGLPYSLSDLTFPPLKVDLDYTVLTFGNGSLSAGAYFSLSQYNSYTYCLVGPMANVRYAFADNFEVFAKAIIGYRQMFDIKRIGAGTYAGITWYFSRNMGIGAEIGYGGPTLLGIHMSFKF